MWATPMCMHSEGVCLRNEAWRLPSRADGLAPLPEACHDHRLAMLLHREVREGYQVGEELRCTHACTHAGPTCHVYCQRAKQQCLFATSQGASGLPLTNGATVGPKT